MVARSRRQPRNRTRSREPERRAPRLRARRAVRRRRRSGTRPPDRAARHALRRFEKQPLLLDRGQPADGGHDGARRPESAARRARRAARASSIAARRVEIEARAARRGTDRRGRCAYASSSSCLDPRRDGDDAVGDAGERRARCRETARLRRAEIALEHVAVIRVDHAGAARRVRRCGCRSPRRGGRACRPWPCACARSSGRKSRMIVDQLRERDARRAAGASGRRSAGR